MSSCSPSFGLFSARPGGLAAIAIAVAALLAGCSPDAGQSAPPAELQLAAPTAPAPAAPMAARSMAKMASMEIAPAADVAMGQGGAAAPSARFLAISHRIQVETPAAELAALWEEVKARCERLDCYVEGSQLRRETPQSAAEAMLAMRVSPQDFAALTSSLGAGARVLNHQTTTEDKTYEVVDVEAQIKNRIEYRDSLRALMLEKNVKRSLQDLMAIRDTLSQVQAEIDAANTHRALLQRDTAKQFVQMRFQPTRAIVSGTYSPWQQTWQRSWDGLTRSVQSLILTAAQALPWLLALALVVLLPLRFAIKRWMRRSAAWAQVAQKAGTKD